MKILMMIKFDGSFLTLFRMGEGAKSPPPTGFSSVTSANVGISPKNFLTFSFNTFAGVKYQVYA